MKKTARIIYLIIGAVFPILIGALHTYVHFDELLTPEVQNKLNDTIPIHGAPELLFNTWGLMSFMMGASFIVIGLLNISIFSQMKKEAYPPLSALFAMVVYLLCVIYAANEFSAMEQFYGSIFGLVLTTICIFLSLKKQ